MPGAAFGAEFGGRIHRGIYFAAQNFFRRGQGGYYGLETRLAHHHEVHIALRTLAPLGEGTINEGRTNLFAQGLEGGVQYIAHSRSFGQQTFQLFEDRTILLRLEINLPSLDGAPENSGSGEAAQLSLRSSQSETRQTGGLPQVVGLPWACEEQSQDAAAGEAEEGRSGSVPRISRSHYEYKCTHF